MLVPVKSSAGSRQCPELSERHGWKGTSGELDNMQGRLAPGVSSATLGSLDICGRPPRATKWHAHVFVGVPGNECRVMSCGSQGGLDTLTTKSANIVCAWHVQC